MSGGDYGQGKGLGQRTDIYSLSDLRTPLHPPTHKPVPELLDADEPAIFGPRGAADLDNPDGKLKIKIVDGPAEHLRPETPASTTSAAAATPGAAPTTTAPGQGVDPYGGAHVGELSAE